MKATQRLYRDRPGGGRELAYPVGAEISEEDAIAFGLTEPPSKPATQKAEPKKRASKRCKKT